MENKGVGNSEKDYTPDTKKPPSGDLISIPMVPKAGLEPARISTVDFESTASTDFATPARKGMRKTLRIIPLPATFATSIVRSVR